MTGPATPDHGANGAAIEREIAWFLQVVDRRFRIHGGEPEGEAPLLAQVPPPPLAPGSAFADTLAALGLAPEERLIVILALLPVLRPSALDSFLLVNQQTGRVFSEFGGIAGATDIGFRPTWETALFLIAGERMDRRLAAMRWRWPEARLQCLRVLEARADSANGLPSDPLAVASGWCARLTGAGDAGAGLGEDVPATRMTERYDWDDLVLPEHVLAELDEMVTWVENEQLFLETHRLRKHVKPGFRALFHGPPGTGKTMAAGLLGKRLGRPVYRVDLSRVVSKWIGETEKNLALLFDRAESGDLILFFDEADALFGKRGEATSASERHANQQVAYLLQRIEDSPGILLLASNLRSHIDAAFARRLQLVIHFQAPDAELRHALWRRVCTDVGIDPASVDLVALSAHEMTGADIVGAIRRACIRCLPTGEAITTDVLQEAVRVERLKAGRLVLPH